LFINENLLFPLHDLDLIYLYSLITNMKDSLLDVSSLQIFFKYWCCKYIARSYMNWKLN